MCVHCEVVKYQAGLSQVPTATPYVALSVTPQHSGRFLVTYGIVWRYVEVRGSNPLCSVVSTSCFVLLWFVRIQKAPCFLWEIKGLVAFVFYNFSAWVRTLPDFPTLGC